MKFTWPVDRLSFVRNSGKYQHNIVTISIGVGALVVGILVGQSRGIPFVAQEDRWSIGIYTGQSPTDLSSPDAIKNPVLTAEDITDIPARFVADPFMIKENSTWYMFFEVLNAQTKQGDIGLAISRDGLSWTYRQIVLDEPFHMSYPYVFKSDDDIYMLPETEQAKSIRLYKATVFPTEWSFVGTLLEGTFDDPSIFFFDDRWWLFAETNPLGNDTLGLYYSDELIGPWIEHPASPVVHGDPNLARPGGRALVLNGTILRYAQDDEPTYGNQVRAFQITSLSTSDYAERMIDYPVLEASGSGWNSMGMHHVDPHQISSGEWIASVDGFGEAWLFGLEY